MKPERAPVPVLDLLQINNGAFDVTIDRNALADLLQQVGQAALVPELWSHLGRFADQVELLRLRGLALGSTDPVGAVADQIYSFSETCRTRVHLTDPQICRLFC
jgi:hypothetical protein